MDLLHLESCSAQPDAEVDLDADGLVDVADVIILLKSWGVI